MRADSGVGRYLQLSALAVSIRIILFYKLVYNFPEAFFQCRFHCIGFYHLIDSMILFLHYDNLEVSFC